jgi:hypothetical protein
MPNHHSHRVSFRVDANQGHVLHVTVVFGPDPLGAFVEGVSVGAFRSTLADLANPNAADDVVMTAPSTK